MSRGAAPLSAERGRASSSGGAMHLVQLLLPLYDNERRPFARERLDAVRAELAERFGGVTAFLRAPASGVWVDDGGEVPATTWWWWR